MRVVVLGAGGIGGVVAAHLARAEHRVTIVDRDEQHLRAIAAGGLSVQGEASFVAHPDVISPDALPGWAAAADGVPDIVCVAVKATDTAEAIRSIADVVRTDHRPGPLLVSLQNGWESFLAAESFGDDRVAAAHMTWSAYKQDAGQVRYTGAGSFHLGMLDGRPHARLAEFATALSVFHPVDVTDNIVGWLWAKAALSSFYYATALVSVDVPEIIRRTGYRPALSRLVGEVAAVAQARGVRLEAVDGFSPAVFAATPSDAAAVAGSWDAHERFWSGRGQQRTGVWRDLAVHHRKTEVTSSQGQIVRWAAEASIPTPLLAAVVKMITEVESGVRELGWHNLEELAALDAAGPGSA